MAKRSQKTSLTVHDFTQRSQLISEGPPARYRLLTSRSNLEKNGSVRKWTFGQRDVKMENKILLMVGETGTGKTTLINAMVNYTLGVKFTDEVWFEITEEGGEDHKSDQSESQTAEITVYEVFAQDNPMCLTIIDTPGYGDTRGRDKDKQIAENLYKLFHSDSVVKEIDAVCLVVKASENRLSDRQKYIIDAVLSLFGKDIENNIVICVTHSDGMPPTNALNAIKKAKVLCRKNEENEPEHFLFNNRQAEKRNPKYNRQLKTAWEQTDDSLNDLFASLKEQNRKSLEQTNSVLIESKRLKACINNLQQRIHFIECKSKELAEIQTALEKNQEKIKRDENFTIPVTKYFREKVLIKNASWGNRRATSCSVCKENCHEYGCWSAWNAWWCYVMKSGHCTVCTGKCSYTEHVRENKKYVTTRKETKMTYYEFKKEYGTSNNLPSDISLDSEVYSNHTKKVDGRKKEEENQINIEHNFKEVLAKTEKEKADLVDEAYNAIMKLFEIALKPNSAFIVKAIIFLIPRAKETGKCDYALKLEELRRINAEAEETAGVVAEYAKDKSLNN